MTTNLPKGRSDVALILEGTYPYISGGVSTWVHQIITAYPSRRFSLWHIASHPGSHGEPRYKMPENVTELVEIHCRGATPPAAKRATRRCDPLPPRRAPSRTLAAIRRLHLGNEVDDALIADLSANDLTIGELLHGADTFELLRQDLYEKVSPSGPFMDFFWQFRAMHIPLLRLLAAPPVDTAVYHACSAGYAGLIGAIASYRTGRPFVLTEHGLYAREREMELARAPWIQDLDGHAVAGSRPSPLRRFWSHFFHMLSKIAYHQAAQLVTLSEVNRSRQIEDGADSKKIVVVPNGVSFDEPPPPKDVPLPGDGLACARPMLIGFVGRVVPIKDVITLVKAVALAREQVPIEVWIIGPQDEDAGYSARCRTLCSQLGLDDTIKFLGPQPVSKMYPQLDVVLLTSLSEGQPLVILEAYAAGVPVISTDAGCCRELIEGGDELDRRLGPSGIVTRISNPAETAAAIVRLARDPELRLAMGKSARARVAARYQLNQLVASYENLYASMAA